MRATIPYIEKQTPNCILSSPKTSSTVGLNTRDNTKGRIKTDSPANMSITR